MGQSRRQSPQRRQLLVLLHKLRKIPYACGHLMHQGFGQLVAGCGHLAQMRTVQQQYVCWLLSHYPTYGFNHTGKRQQPQNAVAFIHRNFVGLTVGPAVDANAPVEHQRQVVNRLTGFGNNLLTGIGLLLGAVEQPLKLLRRNGSKGWKLFQRFNGGHTTGKRCWLDRNENHI